MSLTDLVAQAERLTATAFLGGQRLLGLDTNPVPRSWSHITKVDPEEAKRLPLAFPCYLSHTSAVAVGGSTGVTDRNTEETFDLVTAAQVPAFHEPSAPSHVTEQTRSDADFLAIPEVLNGDSEALVGTLGAGLDHVREELGPAMLEEKTGLPSGNLLGGRLTDFATAYLLEEAVFEAYIIMNTDSAAAQRANVTDADLLSAQEARERALAAEYHLESEIVYLEYSGTFGGSEAIEMLETIDDAISTPRLWYGGGLDNRENARAALDAGADAVIVGDIFHDIADLEADLVEQARAEFDGRPADEQDDESAESDTLSEWVEQAVDIEETSAARYLSTIPTVADPEHRALTYLTGAVEMALELDELAAEFDDPDAATLDDALDDRVPGESQFADALGRDAETVARRVVLGVLGARFDVETDDGFVPRHLATT